MGESPVRRPRGLIDTSVVIDLGMIDPGALPEELAVSAITMAELAAYCEAREQTELDVQREANGLIIVLRSKYDMQRYGKLDAQSGPVRDMILNLVQRHVAITSTLPVLLAGTHNFPVARS